MIAFNAARLPAYFLTRSARFCSRLISASFAIAASVSKRKFKCGEKRFSFIVGLRCRRDADIHPAQHVNLVVLDFGENDLLFHTDIVVSTPIERPTRYATEIAYARHRNSDETVKKFVHPSATQSNHAADRITLANLEACDRLARLGDNWLLAGNFCQIAYRMLNDLLVRNCLRQPHVESDLGKTRNLHHRLVTELAGQVSNDFFFIEFLQTGHDFLNLNDFATGLENANFLAIHILEANAISLATCRIKQCDIGHMNWHQLVNDAASYTSHRVRFGRLFGDID